MILVASATGKVGFARNSMEEIRKFTTGLRIPTCPVVNCEIYLREAIRSSTIGDREVKAQNTDDTYGLGCWESKFCRDINAENCLCV